MPQLFPASCQKALWKVFPDSKLIVRIPKSHNEEKISRTIETPEIGDLVPNNVLSFYHKYSSVQSSNPGDCQ